MTVTEPGALADAVPTEGVTEVIKLPLPEALNEKPPLPALAIVSVADCTPGVCVLDVSRRKLGDTDNCGAGVERVKLKGTLSEPAEVEIVSVDVYDPAASEANTAGETLTVNTDGVTLAPEIANSPAGAPA